MPTLLLIDDEPVIQHAFRKAFHAPEFITHTARTAAEGLTLFAEHPPDVVVVDVHLPDATGLETFEQHQGCRRPDARDSHYRARHDGTGHRGDEARGV